MLFASVSQACSQPPRVLAPSRRLRASGGGLGVWGPAQRSPGLEPVPTRETQGLRLFALTRWIRSQRPRLMCS